MNALKHAGPCEIRVSTISGDADLTLRVADNGKGFDASQAATHPHRCGGFGLFGIRQRL